ncbi:MAG: pseudouridine synthase [Rhizobacter sp.]
MATLKLKPSRKTPTSTDRPARAPVRGAGNGLRHRPTLSEAQAERAEREALWQREHQARSAPTPAQGDRKSPRPDRVDARPPARTDTRRPPPAPARGRSDRHPPPTADSRSRELPRGAPNTAFGRPAAKPNTRAPSDDFDNRGAASSADAPRGFPQADDRQAGRTGPVTRDRERSAQRARDSHASPSPIRTPSPPPPSTWSGSEPPEHPPGSMRLSKRMSELGLASRREADEWIEKGWVRVDGQVVRELGSRVVVGQHITIDTPARQMQAQKVTVLINKPIGYVSGQAEDGYEPAFVLVTPQNQWTDDASGTRFSRDHLRSLVPAGRLDIDSVGLLVLTQDGRVAKTLIGENSPIEKEYLVRVQSLSGEALPQALSSDQLALLNHGLSLDDEALRPAKVEWVNEDQLRFVLVEGKKRQIRRMCEAVGLKVTGLKRVRIGRIMLGDLPVGQWRYLRTDEAF